MKLPKTILKRDYLNEEMYSHLKKEHKDIISLIIYCQGSKYYYKKTALEQLWKYNIEILTDIHLFFLLQEMEEFAEYINAVIEIKTLESITRQTGIKI